jgi:extradiol dioxygenase family protein
MTSDNSSYLTYGTSAKANDIVRFLDHFIKVNRKTEANGNRKTPVCIWGSHGIGKTELVEDFAKSHGLQMAYVAPAQFEEMGDLLGMPQIVENKTHFAPPEWVPNQNGPGILLIDDVNRADDRILRGIMQLLQNYELASWKLPPDWHIILTANPDGGDYSVTPLDDAMLTRMRHITMEFDVKEWAKWAEKKGVDPRGIHFVLTQKKLFIGNRTTPRTLVHFFESIENIKNLKKNKKLVQLLADASLDRETVTAFLSFIDEISDELPSPDTILNTPDFQNNIYTPLRLAVVGDNIRNDILSAVSTRLLNHIEQSKATLSEDQLNNVGAFLKMDFFPADLRFSVAQDIASSTKDQLKNMLADPDLGKLLLMA